MKTIAVASMCVLASPMCLFAQIELPDEVDAYKPIVASVSTESIPEGAEIKTTWNLEDGMSMVQVSPTEIHLWAVPGKTYTINTTVVWMKFREVEINGELLKVTEAWDLIQFSKETTVKAGDKPNPPDPPDPPEPDDVPEDEFGNVGREAYSVAVRLDLDKTDQVAAIHEEAAARILGEKTPLLVDIDAAVKFMADESAKLELSSEWSQWGSAIDSKWRSGVVSDRTDAGNFWKAVAVGLRAVEGGA